MRVVLVGVGTEFAVRILPTEEARQYKVTPPVGERYLFCFGFDASVDPETVAYVEEKLLKDERLRRGVARLLLGMFGDGKKWAKEHLKEIVGKTIDAL